MNRGNAMGNGKAEQSRKNYEELGICYDCGKRLVINDPEFKENQCECERKDNNDVSHQTVRVKRSRRDGQQ